MEDLIEPASYKEVMDSRQHDHWIAAMQAEINKLTRIGTWKLVKLSKEWKIIKECWIYHIKLNANNKIVKFKACWVTKDFEQIFSIDYNEIYVSTSCHTMVRILLALTAKYWWVIEQADANLVFLNNQLRELIYMKFSTDFAAEYEASDLVCLLILVLYDLKQSVNVWARTLGQSLKKIDFIQNPIDNCLFEHKSGARFSTRFIYILVHVDNILFISESLTSARTDLSNIFFMTDLEEAKYYLDMKIEWNANHSTLWLSQKIYLQQVLDCFDTGAYAKTHPTLMTENFAKSFTICEDDKLLITDLQTDYQQITESLLYAIIQTHSNLITALSKLSQFNIKATFFHFKAQIRAL